MVSIVIVSHSAKLAAGVVELAREMAPDVQIAAAGGLNLPDSPLGTDAVLILNTIEQVYSDKGVLVLMDMGSAILSTEMAVEQLPPEHRKNISLCSAPLVEGAITAALRARFGHTLAEITHEALEALDVKRSQLGEHSSCAPPPLSRPEPSEAEFEIGLPIINHHGLHARPAARFLQTAARFQAEIQVRNLTTGAGPASAGSIKDVMMLNFKQGHEMQLQASGPEAQEALRALKEVLDDINAHDDDLPAPEPMATPGIKVPANSLDTDISLSGVSASRGIAIGPAQFLRVAPTAIPTAQASDPQAEWERLMAAWDETKRQIELHRENLSGRTGRDMAGLFDAHLLLLQDTSLRQAARQAIFNLGHNCARAWQLTVEQTAAEYETLENDYLRVRAADIREVGRQVLLTLLGHPETVPSVEKPAILIAADLGLDAIAKLDPGLILGICTEQGATTSHTAILARNLGIPTVLALGNQLSNVTPGSTVIVDGDAGIIWIEPSFEILEEYQRRADALGALQEQARVRSAALAFTRDGRRVEVTANIGSTAEAKAATANGAEGVGLYRSEFLFLARETAPDEEEQVAAYRAIAQILDNRPLVIRTLDIGGDKALPYLALQPEANPFLGLRGLRLSLKFPDLFKTQLRAILRLAAEFPIKLMFPMVTTLNEWRQAMKLLSEARTEVVGRGWSPPSKIETGIMIEVPAAALRAEQFAPVVDFFSIGSNDLTQYTLAAERGNSEVATLGDSLQPAVLQLIQHVVEVAHSHGKWVGVCGEMAGDPVTVPLLVGLGIDELSMNPPGIPLTKQIIRSLDFHTVENVAKASLALENAETVRAFLSSLETS